jgi:hypothetical protein
LNHAFKIGEDIARCDADRPNALLEQPSVATSIVSGTKVMGLAIYLDAQLGLIAVEIENIGSGGMLAPKAQARLFLA